MYTHKRTSKRSPRTSFGGPSHLFDLVERSLQRANLLLEVSRPHPAQQRFPREVLIRRAGLRIKRMRADGDMSKHLNTCGLNWHRVGHGLESRQRHSLSLSLCAHNGPGRQRESRRVNNSCPTKTTYFGRSGLNEPTGQPTNKAKWRCHRRLPGKASTPVEDFRIDLSMHEKQAWAYNSVLCVSVLASSLDTS